MDHPFSRVTHQSLILISDCDYLLYIYIYICICIYIFLRIKVERTSFIVEIGKMTKQFGCIHVTMPEWINLVSNFSYPISKYMADLIFLWTMYALPAMNTYVLLKHEIEELVCVVVGFWIVIIWCWLWWLCCDCGPNWKDRPVAGSSCYWQSPN